MRDLEIICVDDGSTDGSPAILAEFAAKDPRVKVVSRAHENAGAARNAGFRCSSAGHLAFLDADDVYSPVMLESLHEALESHGAEVASCGYVRFQGDLPPPPLADVVDRRFSAVDEPAGVANPYHSRKGWAWDSMFTRGLLEGHGLSFQEQPALNDFAFTMSAVCLAKRLASTPTVLVAHRNHADSIESTRERAPRCFAHALKRHNEILEREGIWRKYPSLRKAFANYTLRLAFWSLDTMKSSSAESEVYDELKTLLPDMGIPVDDPVYLDEDPVLFRRYRKIMDGLDLVAFLRSEQADSRDEIASLRRTVASLEGERASAGERLQDVTSSVQRRESLLRADIANARTSFEALKASYVYRLGATVAAKFGFVLRHAKGFSVAEPAFPSPTALPAIGYPQRFQSANKPHALPLTDRERAQGRPSPTSSHDRTVRNVAHDACTGCAACVNRCPKDAIRMEYDGEGFLHPVVDVEKCVNCGLCMRVCPAVHPAKLCPVPPAYAVWASDAVRLQSSSGGMFSILAEYVLSKGGAVCGAAYSDDFMEVRHVWAESPRALGALRGSKYVQSDTGLTYRRVKELLDGGRMVLYTGCPCQIAGLYGYLGGRDHPGLLTADLVCHGANSVFAYQSFLREFSGGREIAKVDFRDKKLYAWSTPAVVYLKDKTVKKSPWNESKWYEGFLNGVMTRQNCYACPYARAERVGDVTMGDCWGVREIDKSLDDRKGTTLALVNSPRGREVFDAVRGGMKLCREIPLDQIRKFNGQLNRPMPQARERRFFFSHLERFGYHKSLWYGRGMRWDVGIVGWWFASNYGSSLTYYALGSILEDMGHPVIFIPVAKPDGTPFEPEIAQTVDFIARHFRIARERDFRHMPEYNRFCDAFLVGSDQMWTASTTNLVGYSFFLDFVAKDKKKVAYSTSFGKSSFNGTQQQVATAKDFLSRFDAISTRETTGVEVCRNQFGIDAQHVFDPVFLCSKERYDMLTSETPPRKGAYLLCYILDPTPEKEAAAESIANRAGLEVVTIFGVKEHAVASKKWRLGEVLPKISTDSFVNYVRHCSYLLTDSHHGTCFGIIYRKKYMAFVNEARGRTRFDTVAGCLGLESRLVNDPAEIMTSPHVFSDIDYDAVERRLAPLVDYARKWLVDALAKPVSPAVETDNTRREEARRVWA